MAVVIKNAQFSIKENLLYIILIKIIISWLFRRSPMLSGALLSIPPRDGKDLAPSLAGNNILTHFSYSQPNILFYF